MEIFLLLARVFLALIFSVAGVAKAARLGPTRQTLIEFGVPERLAERFGWALPAVEIVVALALLSTSLLLCHLAPGFTNLAQFYLILTSYS